MTGTLLLRADADGRMGTGHLMRCLALAQAWQAAGGRATFVSHCPVEALRTRIRGTGAGLVALEHPYPDPADLQTTLALLDEAKPPHPSLPATWVALDGYHFDAAYQQAIGRAGGRLLVIDDSVRLPHYHTDVLLNQNLGAEPLPYACHPEATLLLGCRYALLRPEFLSRQSLHREIPETARHLLVTLGGADPDNVTRTVVTALKQLDVPGGKAKVVIGSANPHWESLRELLRSPSEARAETDVQLLSGVEDMGELMAWADVAISAAGSTCWELALMRLPALVLVLADNQEPVARRLSEAGVVTSLGRAGRLTAEGIAKALSALCRDRDRRAGQSEAGRRMVDGHGARRVVAVMQALGAPIPEDQLRLRPVRPDDVFALWRLRNDPAACRASILSSQPIPLEEHVRWFKQRLVSPDTCMWVLDLHGLALGSIRYDRVEDAAKISLSVAAAFRRRGLGTRLVQQTWRPACRQLDVPRARARVREENLPSMRTFLKAGFTEVDRRTIHHHACYVLEQTPCDDR